jgi:hypothetical protein
VPSGAKPVCGRGAHVAHASDDHDLTGFAFNPHIALLVN